MLPSRHHLCTILDEGFSKVLFAAGLVFLIAVAIVTHQLTELNREALRHTPQIAEVSSTAEADADEIPEMESVLSMEFTIIGPVVYGPEKYKTEIWLVNWAFHFTSFLWAGFAGEAILRFVLLVQFKGFFRHFGYCILLWLIPPLHLGSRGYAQRDEMWLPLLGWRTVDKDFRKRLEQLFSVPMIILALLVIPLLAIQMGWEEQVNSNQTLALALSMGNSLVWLGFAIEFIIMVSAADKKIQYCVRHWVDLAIVLLPLFELLPTLRLLRLGRIMRLQQLTKMGRVYRLRGLALKAWRAFLVLEIIQRIIGSSPEKRLKKLEELYAAKEEELDELRQEMDQIREEIKEKEDASLPISSVSDTDVTINPT